MRKFAINIFFLLFIAYIMYSTFYINPTYAQDVGSVGQSRIHPASPLYFLKSIREIWELKFASTTQMKAFKQLEFATRRIREVNALKTSSQPKLIESTLAQYFLHLQELIGIVNLIDRNLASQVSSDVVAHMNTLQTVYPQVSDPQAKRAIRSAIYRLSAWDQQLIDKLNLFQPSFTQSVLTSKLSGCNFLSQEASSSALNEVERSVYSERATKCLMTNP